MGCVCVYMQKMELHHSRNMVTRKTRKHYLKEKCSLIPWGLRVPILVLEFGGFPNCLDVGKLRAAYH